MQVNRSYPLFFQHQKHDVLYVRFPILLTFATVTCLFLFLTACGSSSQNTKPDVVSTSDCVTLTTGLSARPPCWLSTKPKNGVIVTSAKHVKGWEETKIILFAIALKQLALLEYGVDINIATEVQTSVRVNTQNGDEEVNSQQTVVDKSEIKTRDTVAIKADIKDYYFDAGLQKGYLWAVKHP